MLVKANIALFVLYQTAFGLIMMIILRSLPLHIQTNIISFIAYSLMLLLFILYQTMNLVNHLQLIYFRIFKVMLSIELGKKQKTIKKKYYLSFQIEASQMNKLWLTATMRQIFHLMINILLFPIIILTAFIPIFGFDLPIIMTFFYISM